MATQVFIIGATGHTGATVLDLLSKDHSQLQVTALVRAEKDRKNISERYPNVKTIDGGLDDESLVEKHAATARIVINCAPDVIYATGIRAILHGLASTNQESYYIHTSGAASTWNKPNGDDEGEKVWDDVRDINEILNLPNEITHIETDRIVTEQTNPKIHTAIISPSFILGLSPSFSHPTPLGFPDLIGVIKGVGAGFTIAQGKNRTTGAHVHDIARIYLALVDDAVESLIGADSNTRRDDSIAVWGREAYYFTVNREWSFKEFIEEEIVPALKKHNAPFLASDATTKSITLEKAVEIVMNRYGGVENAPLWTKHIAEIFAVAMRTRGSRAEKVFGFKPEKTDVGMDEAVKVFLERDS